VEYKNVKIWALNLTSRHGEGKKRRRDWDGEEADQGDNCDLPVAAGNAEDSGY